MTSNALDILKESGLIIASDTGEYLKIGEFFPQDATTNPSLVFAAISKPQYAHLTDAAVQYALSRPGSLDLEAQTELACDYLLVQVGMQILNIIPGRVSVSIDPRLADDKDAIVAKPLPHDIKGRTLISLFEELGYTRDRVLIKIPGTYSGILACKALETRTMSMLPDGSESISSPIHTNATLIFGLVQALACAQAGISVISPFIGRVKDWWDARNRDPSLPLSEHPGIQLVRTIRAAFDACGYSSTTTIMAAGFRAVDEVVETGRYGPKGGPDVLTLQPELLEGLRRRPGDLTLDAHMISPVPQSTTGSLLDSEPRYVATEGREMTQAEDLFMQDLEKEGIAIEKVPEGLAKFAVDARKLEDLLREKIRAVSESAPKI
ncbi:hypothetical protein C0989_007563 [Termitomyces sp. Mn162]|nr:hypothetical protein C0989_007563 [Termitomyces sp. Mn162]